MDDRSAVVAALVVVAAALLAVEGHLRPVPVAAGPVLALAAVGLRRPPAGGRVALAVLGAALLAAALGQRSVAGLEAPLDTGPVRAEVTLVGDPAPLRGGAVAVDVRLGDQRLRAMARSAAAAAIGDRLAGERITIIGSVERPGRYERMVRHRHLRGRLAIDTVTGWRAGDMASTAANGLRRTLASGAAVLPARHRALLAGLTLGDDRHQPPDMTEAFRAAGLSHLLAVSGQNVAFVLVVVGPAFGRMRFGPRLVATLGVLAFFALLTRAEPSVLRAVAMAGVAALGTAVGRPASTLRALALGATGMVLVDPLLTTSLGFRLSVLGAAGIVVGADRIGRALPGPRWLVAPLSVTLAAQAAVSPLLVATFDGVPLASVPANLLAAPAAGPIMVWGLTGGLAAGLAGGGVAEVVHVPTRLLLAWLDGVAATAARWPAAQLTAGHLVALAGAAALVAYGRQARRGVSSAAGWVLVAATVAVALVPLRRLPGDLAALAVGPGARVWRSGEAVVAVVDGRADGAALVADLRARRLLPIDVLVVRTGSPAAAEVAGRVDAAEPVGAILAPPRSPALGTVPGAAAPPRGAVVTVGDLRVAVRSAEVTLEVDVSARDPPSEASGAEAGLRCIRRPNAAAVSAAAEPWPPAGCRAPILGARGRAVLHSLARARHGVVVAGRADRPAVPRPRGRCRAGPPLRA